MQANIQPITANGMTNPGAACYAISTVQALRSLDYLVEAMRKTASHPLCRLLLDENAYIGEIINEVNRYNNTKFSTGAQADSDEFYLHLMAAMPTPIQNLFQVRRQGYLKCDNCSYSRVTEARDLEEIQLHIMEPNITPLVVIREFSQTDKLCPKCNYVMTRQDVIRRVSEIVCIHPKAAKLLEYPNTFCIKMVNAQRVYRLQSAVYYSGSGDSGHYWAGGYRGAAAYNFNDGSVSHTPSVRNGNRPRLLFYEIADVAE